MGSGALAYFARTAQTGKPMKSEIPHSYAAWLPLLDRFQEGDDSVLVLMQHGSIEWSAVVAERWTFQLSSALGKRLTMLSKQLQLGLDRSQGESFAIAQAMLNARRPLQRLREFASISCLPDNVRSHLQNEIDRWAQETQRVLEENAAKIRTDNGRLLKTIRDNPLTTIAIAAEQGAIASPDAGDTPVRGRRVIL
jgi:hypothetical protein